MNLNKKLVNSVSVEVVCCKNSPISIDDGAPSYIGLSFPIEKSRYSEMLECIKNGLSLFRIPVLKIYDGEEKEILASKVFDMDDVFLYILDKAPYIKEKYFDRRIKEYMLTDEH